MSNIIPILQWRKPKQEEVTCCPTDTKGKPSPDVRHSWLLIISLFF